jgi:hypothetical protein
MLSQSRGLALAILLRNVQSQQHRRERGQDHQQYQTEPQAGKKLSRNAHDALLAPIA